MTTTTDTTQPSAAWYPDPDRTGGMRYFNGERWTDIRIRPTGLPETPEAVHRRRDWLVLWLAFVVAVALAIVVVAL